MQLIVRSYAEQDVPHVRWCTNIASALPGQTLVLLLGDSRINSRRYSAPAIYISAPEEELNLEGLAVFAQLNDSMPIDLAGYFPPTLANNTELDTRYSTSHTLLFVNKLFRSRDRAAAGELPREAISEHLKAELVELHHAGAKVPLHSHGEPALTGGTIRFGDEDIQLSTVAHNIAHPQLVVVVNGRGRFWLDRESYAVGPGDVLVYGPGVIHGSLAAEAGFSYIHLGWMARSCA